MGLFSKLKKETSWEERQASKLQKLRDTRIKEESRAKLRSYEERERARIDKAKKTGRGQGRLGKIGKGLAEAGKAANAMGEGMAGSFGNDFPMGGQPRRSPEKKSSSQYVIVGGKAYPKGGTRKKKKRSSATRQPAFGFGF